jgi:hypothetical protein
VADSGVFHFPAHFSATALPQIRIDLHAPNLIDPVSEARHGNLKNSLNVMVEIHSKCEDQTHAWLIRMQLLFQHQLLRTAKPGIPKSDT